MTPGLRHYKSASLRVAVPQLPEDFDWEPDYLDRIRELVDVKSGNPRKGHGTGLLRSVCTEADVDSQVLMLQVRQFDDGPSNDKLMSFYGRFGFEVIQVDPVTLMARVPT